MKNTFTAIVFAAAVAALFTLLTAPVTEVKASPLPPSVAAPVAFCAERPWPYYGCVGTSSGNAQVRLVSSRRLAD